MSSFEPPNKKQKTSNANEQNIEQRINDFFSDWQQFIDNDDDGNDNQNEKINEKMESMQKEIALLKERNLSLMDKVQKAEKDKKEIAEKYKKSVLESDQYRLRLKGLAQMIKSGHRPFFECVLMDKMEWRQSAKISQIKKKIALQNHQRVKIVNYHNHKAWTSKDALCASIGRFVECNANLSKPNLLINGDSYPYKFILQTFLIRKGSHRIKALCSGYQRGIKCLMNVPKGTVIGSYVGIEYLYDEYQRIFVNSNEETLRNVYAFDVTLPNKQKMIIDGYGLREKIMSGKEKERKYSAHLLYINDCRQNIKNEVPTKEDSKYWNADFVEAQINGFPMIFVVARRKIERNEEILSWYGTNYDVALNQQNEYQRMKNCIASLVDNTILNGVDLTNDVWTIE